MVSNREATDLYHAGAIAGHEAGYAAGYAAGYRVGLAARAPTDHTSEPWIDPDVMAD